MMFFPIRADFCLLCSHPRCFRRSPEWTETVELQILQNPWSGKICHPSSSMMALTPSIVGAVFVTPPLNSSLNAVHSINSLGLMRWFCKNPRKRWRRTGDAGVSSYALTGWRTAGGVECVVSDGLTIMLVHGKCDLVACSKGSKTKIGVLATQSYMGALHRCEVVDFCKNNPRHPHNTLHPPIYLRKPLGWHVIQTRCFRDCHSIARIDRCITWVKY